MTRVDLEAYLLKRVDAFVGPAKITQTNEVGDTWYVQNVRKVLGQVVNYENITYVVLADTGKDSDTAYFFGTDEIRFFNVQENAELRDKLIPTAPLPPAALPAVTVKP